MGTGDNRAHEFKILFFGETHMTSASQRYSDSTFSGNESNAKRKLKKLTRDQITQIDEILASLPDYGEIHLIIQRGELRYINKLESYKATPEKMIDE